MDYDKRAFGNNYERNPEFQRHSQSCEDGQRFRDWFHGNEIRGELKQAITALAGKLAQMEEIDMMLLQKAYFYEPPKKDRTYEISNDPDDLPF